ncbi:hypothetical protein C3E98_030740, partial [Pseudomonas sp. MWU13-2625]
MTNLSHPAPQFSPRDAEQLAEQLFNVVATASPLDGEREFYCRMNTDSDAGCILHDFTSSVPT